MGGIQETRHPHADGKSGENRKLFLILLLRPSNFLAWSKRGSTCPTSCVCPDYSTVLDSQRSLRVCSRLKLNVSQRSLGVCSRLKLNDSQRSLGVCSILTHMAAQFIQPKPLNPSTYILDPESLQRSDKRGRAVHPGGWRGGQAGSIGERWGG